MCITFFIDVSMGSVEEDSVEDDSVEEDSVEKDRSTLVLYDIWGV